MWHRNSIFRVSELLGGTLRAIFLRNEATSHGFFFLIHQNYIKWLFFNCGFHPQLLASPDICARKMEISWKSRIRDTISRYARGSPWWSKSFFNHFYPNNPEIKTNLWGTYGILRKMGSKSEEFEKWPSGRGPPRGPGGVSNIFFWFEY